ncbi:MAG: hypothetical protein RL577_192 [Bacteroidota bacterium]
MRTFLLIVAVLAVASCKHESQNPDAPTGTADDICFERDILPIFQSNCAMSGCHDASTQADGVQLTSYSTIMNTGEIEPGKPNSSEAYREIANGKMPPYGYTPLSQAQKDLLYKWIADGAKNGVDCPSTCDSNTYTYSGAVSKIMAQRCVGCHSGSNASGGIDLSSHAAVKAQATRGALLGSIQGKSPWKFMPQGGTSLSDCEIAQIRKWMEAGTPND